MLPLRIKLVRSYHISPVQTGYLKWQITANSEQHHQSIVYTIYFNFASLFNWFIKIIRFIPMLVKSVLYIM